MNKKLPHELGYVGFCHSVKSFGTKQGL